MAKKNSNPYTKKSFKIKKEEKKSMFEKLHLKKRQKIS